MTNEKKTKGGAGSGAAAEQTVKKQKTAAAATERLYYKYEDELFSKHAEVSFSYMTTFRETMEDGNKQNFTGGNGAETHYKLIYLIKFSEYEKRINELAKYI